jgi:hypothetical protein
LYSPQRRAAKSARRHGPTERKRPQSTIPTTPQTTEIRRETQSALQVSRNGEQTSATRNLVRNAG